jgi:hypothetical protein
MHLGLPRFARGEFGGCASCLLVKNPQVDHAASAAVEARRLRSHSPTCAIILSKNYRYFDPVLGIFTGLFAFYLHEHNPRTAPPEDQRLSSLLQWKLAKWRRARAEKMALEESAAWKS